MAKRRLILVTLTLSGWMMAALLAWAVWQGGTGQLRGLMALAALFTLLTISVLVRLKRWSLKVVLSGNLAIALLLVFAPGWLAAHREEQFQGCVKNLLHLETELRKHPGVLRSVPLCPAAGFDTYSATYVHEGNAYTICCGGFHHYQAGLPRLDTSRGLVPGPQY